jgi:putative membrane protein
MHRSRLGEVRASTERSRLAGVGALLLLTCAAGCAGKDAGPQQPISENLAPAVASPPTEAYSPMGTSSTGVYSDATNPSRTSSTAPLNEQPTTDDERYDESADGKTRQTTHTFTPKVNRVSTGRAAPVPGTATSTTVVTGLTDGQIIRIAETMQNTELAEVAIVEDRAQDARVKEFAERLKSDSKRLKERTQQLAKSTDLEPAESPVSADIRVKASQELTSVELARPEDFDQAFIDAQVQQNREMLQLLNSRLIPSATEPALRDELTKSRAVLERQGDEAKDIQRSLQTGTTTVPR